MCFPVFFLYPQHHQSDFISSFPIHDTLATHLHAMLIDEPPAWDLEHRFSRGLDRVRVSFEAWGNDGDKRRIEVPVGSELGKVLRMPDCVLYYGGIVVLLVEAI